jgi:hypothetical protein
MWLYLGCALRDRNVGEILRGRGMLVDHPAGFLTNRTDSWLTPIDVFRHSPFTPLS